MSIYLWLFPKIYFSEQFFFKVLGNWYHNSSENMEHTAPLFNGPFKNASLIPLNYTAMYLPSGYAGRRYSPVSCFPSLSPSFLFSSPTLSPFLLVVVWPWDMAGVVVNGSTVTLHGIMTATLAPANQNKKRNFSTEWKWQIMAAQNTDRTVQLLDDD